MFCICCIKLGCKLLKPKLYWIFFFCVLGDKGQAGLPGPIGVDGNPGLPGQKGEKVSTNIIE